MFIYFTIVENLKKEKIINKLMNNIVKVAQDKDKILKAKHLTKCSLCGQKQWSPFDKLYTETYEQCADCCSAETVKENSVNIFKLLESE